jgi:uncharacterized repeat protein (TIGR01451 family)
MVASAALVVVPNSNLSVEGTGGTANNMATPFDCNYTGFTSQRVQQVYLGTEVGSGKITQIAFRPDGTNGVAFGPTTINGVTITLSTTSAAPDVLAGGTDAMMDSNVGGDVVTVFSGNLILQSAATGGPPRNFDIVIPLTTPFTFNSSSGNLLMEVNIPTCTQAATTFFDTQETTGDSISRTHHWEPGPLFFSDSAGLVTQFTIELPADMFISKADAPDPVIAGNNLTYTLTVMNSSPNPAADVLVTDNLPSNTSFVSCNGSIGTCGGSGNARTISYASFAGNTSDTPSLVTRVCPEAACNTVLSNTATVSSSTPDPISANNSSGAITTTVQSQADLSITKSDTPDPIVRGNTITYTVAFQNNGPSNSATTQVIDTLPPGFVASSATSTVGSCSGVGTNTVTCNVGTLGAANQCMDPIATSGTITITTQVPFGLPPNAVVTNSATISGGDCLPDPAPANNSASASTGTFRQAPTLGGVALVVLGILLAVAGVRLRTRGRLFR